MLLSHRQFQLIEEEHSTFLKQFSPKPGQPGRKEPPPIPGSRKLVSNKEAIHQSAYPQTEEEKNIDPNTPRLFFALANCGHQIVSIDVSKNLQRIGCVSHTEKTAMFFAVVKNKKEVLMTQKKKKEESRRKIVGFSSASSVGEQEEGDDDDDFDVRFTSGLLLPGGATPYRLKFLEGEQQEQQQCDDEQENDGDSSEEEGESKSTKPKTKKKENHHDNNNNSNKSNDRIRAIVGTGSLSGPGSVLIISFQKKNLPLLFHPQVEHTISFEKPGFGYCCWVCVHPSELTFATAWSGGKKPPVIVYSFEDQEEEEEEEEEEKQKDHEEKEKKEKEQQGEGEKKKTSFLESGISSSLTASTKPPREICRLTPFRNSVNCCSFSMEHSTQMICAASVDKTVVLANFRSGLIHAENDSLNARCSSLLYTRDNKNICLGTDDGRVVVVDPETLVTKTGISTHTPYMGPMTILSMALAFDSVTVVVGSDNCYRSGDGNSQIRLYSLKTQQSLFDLQNQRLHNSDQTYALCFISDKVFIASTSTGELRFYRCDSIESLWSKRKILFLAQHHGKNRLSQDAMSLINVLFLTARLTSGTSLETKYTSSSSSKQK